MDNLSFLLAAFIVIWVLFFGYLLFLYRKQRRLQEDVDSLKDFVRRNE